MMAIVAATTLAAQSPAPMPPAVSADWLSVEIGDPSLVVLQLGSDDAFHAAHLPNAQHLDYEGVLVAPVVEGGLRLELPSAAQLQDDLRALGVHRDSRIVIVFDDPRRFHVAGRAFFTLEWAGLRGRVAVLDGGLPAWRAAGGDVATGPAAPPMAGDVVLRPAAGLLATRDSVLASTSGRGRRLVDARTPEFYDDLRPNGQPRGGHIPSAVNLPFSSVVDDQGLLKPRDELEQLLQRAGIAPEDALTTYCHIGLQASWAYFALRTLGRDVTLYDGSFEEWSRDAELPVEGQRSPRP